MKKKGVEVIFSVTITLILIWSLFLFFILYQNYNKIPSCNDGTLYGSCSFVKPFYCFNGSLIEKASVCGCSDISTVSGEECYLEYKEEPKNISLNYTLRGESGNINFTVYKKLYDYLSEIPRYIHSGENLTSLSLRLEYLDEANQNELLLPLVVSIENLTRVKEDQARIAVSIIQNIPFGSTGKTFKLGNKIFYYERYPYEVLYDLEGVCGEKSALLIFLLKELGYSSAFLYYPDENHEAVGISCPVEESTNKSGYCFIETTGPSIISDDKTEYIGIEKLNSIPSIIEISGNLSFGKNLYEYNDADILEKIRERAKEHGTIYYFQHIQYQLIKKKYGLN